MTRRLVVVLAAISFACCLQSYAGGPASANREALIGALRRIALIAQRYYHTPVSEGGGGGSFANLVLSDVLIKPLTPYGAFSSHGQNAVSIRFTGTGRDTGYDASTPVEVEITVYADSIHMVINN